MTSRPVLGSDSSQTVVSYAQLALLRHLASFFYGRAAHSNLWPKTIDRLQRRTTLATHPSKYSRLRRSHGHVGRIFGISSVRRQHGRWTSPPCIEASSAVTSLIHFLPSKAKMRTPPPEHETALDMPHSTTTTDRVTTNDAPTGSQRPGPGSSQAFRRTPACSSEGRPGSTKSQPRRQPPANPAESQTAARHAPAHVNPTTTRSAACPKADRAKSDEQPDLHGAAVRSSARDPSPNQSDPPRPRKITKSTASPRSSAGPSPASRRSTVPLGGSHTSHRPPDEASTSTSTIRPQPGPRTNHPRGPSPEVRGHDPVAGPDESTARTLRAHSRNPRPPAGHRGSTVDCGHPHRRHPRTNIAGPGADPDHTHSPTPTRTRTRTPTPTRRRVPTRQPATPRHLDPEQNRNRRARRSHPAPPAPPRRGSSVRRRHGNGHGARPGRIRGNGAGRCRDE